MFFTPAITAGQLGALLCLAVLTLTAEILLTTWRVRLKKELDECCVFEGSGSLSLWHSSLGAAMFFFKNDILF